MADIIQIRRDTAANWTSVNPVLADGEEGYETDSGQRKVGDGVTAWSGLSYAAQGGDLSVTLGLGNITDGNDIEVSAGDKVILDDATASRVAGIGASKEVVSLDTSTYPSLTELAYVKGVTSAIQTQLNNKDASGAAATAQANAEAYADSLVVGLWDDRGSFDASVNAYPSSGGSGTAGAILKGDVWTISVAGTLPTAQVVGVGDLVRALVDTPGNTQANWAITENNIGFVPENVANKDTDGTLAANSDTKYASQKATKTYADSVSSNASVIAKVLTAFAASAGTVTSSDSILSAFQKIVGNIALSLTANTPITGATKTKITYDANGLVTAGADATTADIADSSNKRYVTDAQQTVLGNTSGTNTGDQTISLTGDVTGSGTGSFATTIAANAVTYTKAYNGVQFAIVQSFRSMFNY